MSEESATKSKPRRKVSAGGEAKGKIAFIGKLGKTEKEVVKGRRHAPPGFDGGWSDSDTAGGRVAVKFDLVPGSCRDTVSACAVG